MSDTFAISREQIQAFAVDAFKDHEITVLTDTEHVKLYRCGQPGSSVYAFYVAGLPGAVAFYGDLGEAILRPSDRDALGWLRGAVRSPSYLIEKVQPQPDREFYAGDAIAWIDEQDNLTEEQRENFHDAIELCASRDYHEWSRALSEEGQLDGYPPGTHAGSAMLWMVEALRWFVAHTDQANTKGGA